MLRGAKKYPFKFLPRSPRSKRLPACMCQHTKQSNPSLSKATCESAAASSHTACLNIHVLHAGSWIGTNHVSAAHIAESKTYARQSKAEDRQGYGWLWSAATNWRSCRGARRSCLCLFVYVHRTYVFVRLCVIVSASVVRPPSIAIDPFSLESSKV